MRRGRRKVGEGVGVGRRVGSAGEEEGEWRSEGRRWRGHKGGREKCVVRR